jgi:hypothetical protein
MELYEHRLHRPHRLESFQFDDWETAWHETKAVFIRSRGGSKTNDFTDWIILRVLLTNERWAWLSCKSGQLAQAMIYVHENPFVRRVQRESPAKYNVFLWTGKMIRFGIVSTSNLGLRLDGILYDEFEDLQPSQQIEVYPQMAGMMTTSLVHKTIYIGTFWIAALINELAEQYHTVIRSYDTLPWLVNSGMIEEEIEAGVTPEWQIDMLYRCIPTAPSGILFPHIEEGHIVYQPASVQYGIDFGSEDMCVGVVIQGTIVYIVEEYNRQLELEKTGYDFLKGRSVECEGGGYNDSDKYGEKSKLMMDRVLATKQAVTNKWKQERQMLGRSFEKIVIDQKGCPNTYRDVKSAVFGPDGLYLKDTKHPNHYLDAFLHALRRHQPSYLPSAIPSSSPSSLRQREKLRERYT